MTPAAATAAPIATVAITGVAAPSSSLAGAPFSDGEGAGVGSSVRGSVVGCGAVGLADGSGFGAGVDGAPGSPGAGAGVGAAGGALGPGCSGCDGLGAGVDGRPPGGSVGCAPPQIIAPPENTQPGVGTGSERSPAGAMSPVPASTTSTVPKRTPMRSR